MFKNSLQQSNGEQKILEKNFLPKTSNGVKNWLSLYNPRYVRSIAYMLQASEYNIRDYINWRKKVKNFNEVENRKHLAITPKSLFVIAVISIILLCIYGAALTLMFQWTNPLKYPAFILIIISAPHFLAYGIIIPLWLFNILIQKPIEFFIIKNTEKILQKHQALKIAIAGSFGKTTMREILKTVLAEEKKTAAPSDNYNTPIGISKFVKKLTGDEEILIFELGEYYTGDVHKLCRIIKPQIGIITGVNEAHLQKFKTTNIAADTIFELADWLKNKIVYVNGENALAKNRASNNHILYNRDNVGNWRVQEARTNLTGTSCILENDNLKIEVKSKLLGLHHIGPLAVATDIALRLGISPEKIQQGIAKTKPFNHRLELKNYGDGVILLDDSYNGNPDGVNAIIEFLTSLKNRRRFYVTPGLVEMGAKTELVHKKIGEKLAKAGIEKIILIKNSVTPYIEQGLKENKYNGEVKWFDNATEAFAALPNLTVNGDIIVLQNDWPDQYA
ncbi:MAG: UDP-N-acetylmuramoyl-tripeptide--D-alanyl-D-alanine ligase [Patescibacteria group bacterium]